MDTLKTFSETIQGNITDYTDKSYFASQLSSKSKKAIKGPLSVRPTNVEDAIQSLREVIQGKKGMSGVGRGKNLLQTWHKWVDRELDKNLPEKTRKLYNAEKAYIQKILKTDFRLLPQAAVTNKIAKKVEDKMTKVVDQTASNTKKAEKLLNIMADESKIINKALTKTMIKKLTKKIIPLLGAGIVIADLVKRVGNFIGEETVSEFSEKNGEYYHKDVGWY